MARDAPLTPKHAASIVVLDTHSGEPRFLMGQRSDKHVFMPGFFVFPGGALEAEDRSPSPLLEYDAQKIAAPIADDLLGHALLNCALREAREETGLNLTAFAHNARYIARATTPPGQVRRYDTRFFLLRADSTALPKPKAPDGELLNVDWFTRSQVPPQNVHRITNIVFDTVLQRINVDPALTGTLKIPAMRHENGNPIIEWE